MDELDRLLTETLRDAAGRAPSDDGLLSGVHRRSGRVRRQRIGAGLSAMAAVLVVSIPTAVVLVQRAPSVIEAPTDGVQLVAGYTPPTFPYLLAATSGMRAPVATMEGGDLIAFFEATELRHHADTTITVSSRKPAFTGPATETPVRVRRHPGTLRTVDVRPAKQLTVYWPESPDRWIRLATDDTYTPQQVLALADTMSAGSTAILPPFRLGLSPAGFVTDTVTESTMVFRMPGSTSDAGEIKAVLRKRRQLTGTNQTIGRYAASLTHHDNGVTLDVDVTDWNATLHVTVGNEITMSDADLTRFAAGIQILNRSNPE